MDSEKKWVLLLSSPNLSTFSHLPPPIAERNVNHFHVSAFCCPVLHLSALLKQATQSERLLGVQEETEEGGGMTDKNQ